MATILDKDVTRESTVKYDDREIQVTLTADQMISFKLKGMKSGVLSIGIGELYAQLRGDDVKKDVKPTSVSVKRKSSEDDASPMISLNRLRSLNMVTPMDMKTKLELEGLISELIKQEIKLFD